jgi:hypothetical protein
MQKVESILQATPNITRSLLMNSSKACNKCVPLTYFSPSIYLSMLPKLALEVTDCIYGSPFTWQF